MQGLVFEGDDDGGGVRQNADNQNLNFVQTLLFEYSPMVPKELRDYQFSEITQEWALEKLVMHCNFFKKRTCKHYRKNILFS